MQAARVDPPIGEPPLPRVGDRIAGKYELERLLGEGGAGIVFAARHLQLGDRVAIKVLRSNDPLAAKRLLVEARATLAIESRHVVRVLDVDVSREGLPYLVMELLEGRDLRALQQERGALPVDDVIAYVLQACAALADAHARGIVHRDLKPANLFLTTAGEVKVLDFGISKARPEGISFDESLTATTAILGSPSFMSPEQVRDAKSVDARADIWALGIVLYQLLTNTVPFEGSTFSSLCAAIVADPPAPVHERRPELSKRLAATVMRCLEKAPERRFASVTELADELRGRPQRRYGALLALSVLALVAVVALLAHRAPPPAPAAAAPTSAAAPIAWSAPASSPASPSPSPTLTLTATPNPAPKSAPVRPKSTMELGPVPGGTPPAMATSATSAEPPPKPSATVDPLAHAY